jgi:hypothetical protein
VSVLSVEKKKQAAGGTYPKRPQYVERDNPPLFVVENAGVRDGVSKQLHIKN